jgi:DNA primase
VLFDPSCVDVLDFLEVLEIENVRREGYHEARFSCPYPGHENGDQSASAYMNLETTAWFCHGCKRKGNAISFCSSMLNISPMKAKRILREAYAPHTLNPDERNIVEELHSFFAKARAQREDHLTNVKIPDAALEKFALDWESAWLAYEKDEGHPASDYMFERGFEWPTLENWDFGYDERTNRVTFAVRDEKGELVGIKARATDDRHPKYLVLGDPRDASEQRYGFTRYYTGSVIFGLHAAVDQFMMLDHGEPAELIVCEGELDAIALWQMGYHTAVALNGSNLTALHTQLIRNYADKATFFFDFDKAGLAGLWGWEDEKGEHHPGALEILSQDLDLFLVGSHEDDPADMLQKGQEGRVDGIIASAKSYTMARLERAMAMR